MSDLSTERLSTLLKDATPGPWQWEAVFILDSRDPLKTNKPHVLAQVEPCIKTGILLTGKNRTVTPEGRANFALMVEAPALAADVLRLRNEVATNYALLKIEQAKNRKSKACIVNAEMAALLKELRAGFVDGEWELLTEPVKRIDAVLAKNEANP